VNLAPADIRKDGSAFDLPMATEQISAERLGGVALEVAAAGGHNILMIGPPG